MDSRGIPEIPVAGAVLWSTIFDGANRVPGSGSPFQEPRLVGVQVGQAPIRSRNHGTRCREVSLSRPVAPCRKCSFSSRVNA